MKVVLIRPIITEKTLMLADKNNQFTFLVNFNAGKIEIAKAVTEKFNVSVLSVSVANTLGKRVRFGKARIEGQRETAKKAVVTLKKGDKISTFEIK